MSENRPVGRSVATSLAWLGALVLASQAAWANPYRLRGNVHAESNARAPVGLLTLDADGDLRPWLTAEAVVWLGVDHDDELGGEADALIIAITARDPRGRGIARLGRILVVPGAVQPVHLDGAYIRAHVPYEFRLELFGGVPAASRAGASRSYDWAVGGRVSRAIGQWGAAGLAFIERRDAGRLDDREIGLDTGFSLTPRLDITARAAYDLVHRGVSEARLASTYRRGPWRIDGYLATLSPARILPATSLFSVLGDLPSTTAGARLGWRAAPRLDLSADLMARAFDDTVAAAATARALLRLDERGRSALSLELRRDAGPDGAGWFGARTAARLAVDERWSAAAEFELVIPDRGRLHTANTPGTPGMPGTPEMDAIPSAGSVWPWGLIALSYRASERWQAAAAVEMSSSPEYRYRVDSMVRLSHRWEGP